MEQHSMLRRVIRSFDKSEQDRLLAKADGLSQKGRKKLNDRLDDNYTRIVRRKTQAERGPMVEAFIDELLKVYPEGCDDSKNLFLESAKKAVVQVDKKTGTVVAEHESVRAAARNTGIDDGSICFCCNNMAGTNVRKGYKSAGGFKWYYKETWTGLQDKGE